MTGRRWSLLGTVLLLALATLHWPAAPAAAQSGADDVEFWTDPPPYVWEPYVIPAPATAKANGYHYLNVNGGRTTEDGLFIVVGGGRYQVVRDRDFQLYDDVYDEGMMRWLVSMDYDGEKHCFPQDPEDVEDNSCDAATGEFDMNWHLWDTITVSNGTDTSVKMTMVGSLPDATVTLTVMTTYEYNKPYVFGVDAKVTAAGAGASKISNVNLYLAADMYLDSEDAGPGVVGTFWDKTIVVQTNASGSAVGGYRDNGTPWTSYLADEYACVFGDYDDCLSGDGTQGPSANEPYSNNVNSSGSDLGIGVHWALGTLPSANITSQVFFALRSVYDLPPPEPTPEPEPTEEPGVDAAAPVDCTLPPTLEIKPELIEIAPGGAATVWVELTNQCADRPTAAADALLSFSDGLSVIETSQDVLNLGQRAALQRFTLGPGETRGWYAIVRAGDNIATPPLAVGELYSGAAVVRTDSTAFVTPAAAPAPVEPAAVPAASAPAAPAPLPSALPNTAGAALPLGLLAVSAAGAAAVILGRRIGRR